MLCVLTFQRSVRSCPPRGVYCLHDRLGGSATPTDLGRVAKLGSCGLCMGTPWKASLAVSTSLAAVAASSTWCCLGGRAAMACALVYSGVPGISHAGLISTPVVSAAEGRRAPYLRPLASASSCAVGSGVGSLGVCASGRLEAGSGGAGVKSNARYARIAAGNAFGW